MHLFFYPLADRYWLVLAIAAAMVAFVVLVGPGRSRVSTKRRMVLAGIRVAIILAVMLNMLRPTLVYTSTHREDATLVLMMDVSRSMQVRDGLNSKSRYDVLRATLDDCRAALKKLDRASGGDFEIKAYTFDAETHPVEIKDGRIPLPDVPGGQQTAIGPGLDDMLRQENGKRILGIVVLTDGRQVALPPRDLPPQDVASRLRHQSYPVYPVVIGESLGLGGVQDVAVTDFPPPASVFVNTQMAIHGEIKINGYVNKEVPVRLLMGTSDADLQEVAATKLKATTDGALMPVDFTYVPTIAGEYKLVLEAVPQPGELVTTNNRQSAFVQVLKGGLRVLYIEGALRVEQKFIRRALDASRDIKVDSIRLDPRHPETLPSDLADLFKGDKYDVYILGDVDSTAFKVRLSAEQKSKIGAEEEEKRTWAILEQLREDVNRGKGLIMLGGFQSFGAGGYADTPLAQVLPVEMDKDERQTLDDPSHRIRTDIHLPGPLQMTPTPHELHHFVLSLASPQANADAWKKLPPLEGANQFVKLTSGAVVLADANGDDRKPLLVTQAYGAGRVLAFAGDSTWHWWMHGFESAHKRFWRQIVLWLAKKDQAEEGSVWVRLDNTRYFSGDRVEFTAGAVSPENEPITDAEYHVEITKPDGKRSPVVMIHKDDFMTGSFRETQQPGDYTIEVTAGQPGKAPGTAHARFTVAEQDLELDNASADADAMRGVAKLSGGETIKPEMLAKWLEELMKKTDYLIVKQETKKTLWDTWWFFAVVLTLWTIEWFLRKRWGLV